MTNFISTKTTPFLTSEDLNENLNKNSIKDTSQAINIQALGSVDFDDWFKNLPKSQAQWVTENNFTAAKDQTLKLQDSEGKVTNIILGLGACPSASGISAYAKLAKSLSPGHYQITQDNQTELSSIGWAISQYEFDHYKADKNAHGAVLVLKEHQQLKQLTPIINGICLVRDLINTPACDMGPSHLSEVMKNLAEQYSADFSEIVGDDLLSKGLNTIHAVGRAAKNKPRLLEMFWGDKHAPKLTLIGKGVCFDTGGLDLKGSAGMRMMKKDMGGAANTLGLAQMIMGSHLKVR